MSKRSYCALSFIFSFEELCGMIEGKLLFKIIEESYSQTALLLVGGRVGRIWMPAENALHVDIFFPG